MEEKPFPYEIRWAHKNEWDTAVKLIWKTFMKFESKDYSLEGIRNFRTFLFGRELRKNFLRGNYQMMVALDKERIIGIISLRNSNFLSLLFVEEEYHKQHIGKELIKTLVTYLKEEVGENSLTVRSSPYATEFYHKLGFYNTSIEQVVAGIRTTPMKLDF